MHKIKDKKLFSKGIIYLILVILSITVLVPVLWVFLASLKQNYEFYGNPWSLPKSLYFENFISAFKTANMDEYMLSSVFVTAVALLILLIVSLPAAYCLSRFEFFGGGVLNALFMAGLFVNVNYIVVPIFLMLRDCDMVFKKFFGQGFLLNNLITLAVVYAATALPFTIYLLSSYFYTLPTEFEEAAYIDGAGYFATMIRVMFPLAKPAIITVILFNFLSFWNEYIISLTLLSKAGGYRTLPVGLMNLMQGQQAKAQYGVMYAGLVLVMLPTIILYITVQKKLTEGMTVGGVKG